MQGGAGAPPSQWRVTYAPGDWLLLAGPSTVVVLEPPAETWAPLVPQLWEQVLSSTSMGDLAGRLAASGFDRMPHFGAFFWTDEGMRSLLRGEVRALDPTSRRLVATGEGVQTWSESGLATLSRVRVELPGARHEAPDLPLVAGVVRVGAFLLDAGPDSLAFSAAPGAAREPADGLEAAGAPVGAVHAVPEPPQPVLPPEPSPAVREVEWGFRTDEAPDGAGRTEETPAGPAESAEPAEPAEPAGSAEPAGPAEPAGSAEPAGPAQSGEPDESAEAVTQEEAVDGDLAATAAMPAVEASPGSGAGDRTELLDAAGPLDAESGDTRLMTTVGGLPPGHPAGDTARPDGNAVPSVLCVAGHPNDPAAAACRVCGAAVPPQPPQLRPRPLLAVLHVSDGNTIDLDRPVRIGRAPSPDPDRPDAARLVTVISPGHDISRSHLEIAPDGWQILVTDLQSTNGTLLVPPHGAPAQDLPSGESVTVGLGSVVELGDGVTVQVDAPS